MKAVNYPVMETGEPAQSAGRRTNQVKEEPQLVEKIEQCAWIHLALTCRLFTYNG